MGGLGPGIGGLELLVIGLIALIVVGPKDLPVLLRKVGRAVGKARAMANEFRASFDEMARQSELDELRKEVEALRRGQGIVPLGAEAEATFRDISDDLNRPLTTATPAVAPPAPTLDAPEEWPDTPPAIEPAPSEADPLAEPSGRPARKSTKKPAAPATSGKKATPKKATPSAPSIKRRGGKVESYPPRKVDL